MIEDTDPTPVDRDWLEGVPVLNAIEDHLATCQKPIAACVMCCYEFGLEAY